MKGLLILAALIVSVGSAHATTSCALGPARLQETRLILPVTCGPAARAVPYPDGPLHIGATLYRMPSGLRGRVAPLPSAELAPGDTLHLPSITFTAGPALRELSFDAAGATGFTHLLVAIWDQKNVCEADGNSESGCSRFQYSLGRVDAAEFPIPVDAWPRPICDKQGLQAAGFFRWVEREGDPAGMAAPSPFDRMFTLNDCYAATGPVGLGFSVRRWRVAPLPAR